MATTVFFAWQSDREGNVCHYLIRDAANDAILRLKETGTKTDAEVEDAPPIGDDVELDHDTKGVPGTPNIAETIKRKIEDCTVFLADVTHVGDIETADGRNKKSQNGNVLIELGQAIARKSSEQILLVFNTAFGDWNELPFDLRHNRKPILYNLPDAKDRGRVKSVRKELANTLVEAFGLMLTKMAEVREQKRAATTAELHQSQNLYASTIRSQFDDQADEGRFTPFMPDGQVLTVTLVPPVVKPQLDFGAFDLNRLIAFKPMFVSGWDHRYYDDRFVNFATLRYDAQEREQSQSATAIYIDGHLLAAGVVPQTLLTEPRPNRGLKFGMIERAMIMTVTEYIKAMRAVGIIGEIWFGMSLLRATNLILLDGWSDSGRPITQRQISPPIVSLPAGLDGTDNPATARAMKPLLDRFWRTANYPRDPFFDRDGNWTSQSW